MKAGCFSETSVPIYWVTKIRASQRRCDDLSHICLVCAASVVTYARKQKDPDRGQNVEPSEWQPRILWQGYPLSQRWGRSPQSHVGGDDASLVLLKTAQCGRPNIGKYGHFSSNTKSADRIIRWVLSQPQTSGGPHAGLWRAACWTSQKYSWIKSAKTWSLCLPRIPTECHINHFSPQHLSMIRQLSWTTACLNSSASQ